MMKKGTWILVALTLVICFALGFLAMTLLEKPLGLVKAEEPEIASQEPGETEEPGETGAPEETEQPEQTGEPEQTEEPGEPENTEERDLSAVKETVEGLIGKLDSDWVVLVRDLESGSEITCVRDGSMGETLTGADSVMIGAGLIRYWVMGAVYDKAASEGGEIPGEAVTLLRSMITDSNNNACDNLVTNYLGGGDAQTGLDAVNAFARSLGCEHTAMRRLLFDNEAHQEGIENTTTAPDCAVLLALLDQGGCVSEKASAEMLDLLRSRADIGYIAAALQGVAGARCSGLGGSLSGSAENDTAVVETGQERYLLCILCNAPYTHAGAQGKITEISSAVYHALEG